MEQTYLAIDLKEDAGDTLSGFPYLDGQYFRYEEEDQIDGHIILMVNLADYPDTTKSQEQFLNTNPNVVMYSIV